jgi:hypothetical protein
LVVEIGAAALGAGDPAALGDAAAAGLLPAGGETAADTVGEAGDVDVAAVETGRTEGLEEQAARPTIALAAAR